MEPEVTDPGGGQSYHLGGAANIDELKAMYVSYGGDLELFDELVRGPYLADGDKKWLSVEEEGYQERLDKVAQLLPIEGLVEVEVVDSRGMVSGRAFAQICGHKHNRGNDTFEIWHLVSSDERYNDWAEENINVEQPYHMHLCRKVNDKGECTHKPQQAKKTGLMHVKTWRPATFEGMLNQEYSYFTALKHLGWVLEQKLKDSEIKAADKALSMDFGAPAGGLGGDVVPEEPKGKETAQATTPKSAPVKKGDTDDQKAARRAAWSAAFAMGRKEPIMVRLEGQSFARPGEAKGDAGRDARRDQRKSVTGYGELPPGGEGKLPRQGRDWKDDISALGEAGEPSASHRRDSRDRSRTPKKVDRKDDRKKAERYMPPHGGGKRSKSPGGGGKEKKKKYEGSGSGEDPPDRIRGSRVVPPRRRKKKKRGSSDPSSSSSKRGDKKRKEKKSKDDEKKRKKRRRSTSSSRGTSDSDEDFYGRESRKFASLLEKAQKHPGKLLRSGLEQMGRYMASRVGDGPGGGAGWREQKVTAYLSQVLFTQYPPQAMGVRNSRELLTLAEAIDQLMAENFASVGDILMQRFKATESSLADGWTVARHQELIRPEHASLTSPQEKAFAARAALQQHRLEAAVHKRRPG